MQQQISTPNNSAGALVPMEITQVVISETNFAKDRTSCVMVCIIRPLAVHLIMCSWGRFLSFYYLSRVVPQCVLSWLSIEAINLLSNHLGK